MGVGEGGEGGRGTKSERLTVHMRLKSAKEKGGRGSGGGQGLWHFKTFVG